jgi:hypothetical protein
MVFLNIPMSFCIDLTDTSYIKVALFVIRSHRRTSKSRIQIILGKISTQNSDLFDWISDNREKATIELNDSNFEHDTQGKKTDKTGCC